MLSGGTAHRAALSQAPACGDYSDIKAVCRAKRELMRRVNVRGRVMLTGAQLGDRYLGRVCVLGFRTRRAHMQACIEDLAQAAAELLE